MNEIIASRTNKLIINAVKLREKKYRDASMQFFFEGRKLFTEALISKVSFSMVFVTQKCKKLLAKPLDTLGCPIYTVTDSVYEKLSLDSSPDGIFCIASKASAHSDKAGSVRFILSSVRDPGNLGTCIRSARAFAVNELILHDCADPYNPKAIRASMGALFRQYFSVTDNILATISELSKEGCKIYPAALTQDSVPLSRILPDRKTVFVVGNEGHGISPEVISACNMPPVIIPMAGDTESLNASVAASLLMWEQSKIL